MADPIRVLGLFAGIGGLERGVAAGLRDVGLDARVVGLVEGEAFGAACLGAAMRRGELAACPIWLGDVREFPASAFAGAVDLVCAGFPCQPASSAGKRRGTDDERWLWPEVVRVARESRARYVFCENVRGLLNVNGGEGFAQVLEGLADLGFDAEWTCVPASAVGAPHRRERVFILGRRDVADGDGSRRERERMPSPDEQRAPRDEPHGRGGDLGDAALELHDGSGSAGTRRRGEPTDAGRGFPAPWPPGPAERDRWREILAADPGLAPATAEPDLRRVAPKLSEGMDRSARVDRLRALGNAVVAEQARVAFRELWRRLGEDVT